MHSQCACRGRQLAAAPINEPLALGQKPVRYLSQRAVGGGHQHHPVSGVCGQAHHTTGGENFVVWVGVEAHEDSRGGRWAAAIMRSCHGSFLVVAVGRLICGAWWSSCVAPAGGPWRRWCRCFRFR